MQPSIFRTLLAVALSHMLGLASGAGLTLATLTLRPNPIAIVPTQPPTLPTPMTLLTPTPHPTDTPTPEPEILPTTPVTLTLQGARDYARFGSAQAPVQIVVFADPQCPFCKKLTEETERQLIETYVKPGKAALTYRHFLFLGPESTTLANAMECAGIVGGREGFWRFHDHAFAHQFPENGGQATATQMLAWAKAIKLNPTQFNACLSAAKGQPSLDLDNAAAQSLRIQGTPILYVNGRPLPGALPFEYVKTVVEGVLGH